MAEDGVVKTMGGLNAILVTKLGLLQSPLSPVWNNVLSTLITIVYVKVALEIGSFVRVKYGVPELSRKFVHLCACSFVLFWPLFDVGHWGWRLNVTVPVVMSLRLIYKVGARDGELIPSPPFV
jgi:hypothetical protein